MHEGHLSAPGNDAHILQGGSDNVDLSSLGFLQMALVAISKCNSSH
jgi:hypothetical protein